MNKEKSENDNEIDTCQFTHKETLDELTHSLLVKPNGFWTESVTVNIEKTTGGDWKVYISTSSGGHEEGFDVFERTRNQAASLLFAAEWAENRVLELNEKDDDFIWTLEDELNARICEVSDGMCSLSHVDLEK